MSRENRVKRDEDLDVSLPLLEASSDCSAYNQHHTFNTPQNASSNVGIITSFDEVFTGRLSSIFHLTLIVTMFY